jgi:hypothetical protein
VAVARAGRVREGGLLLDDLLDNVGHPSADHVIERFQHPRVGDWVPMFSKVNDVTAFRVASIDSARHMLWAKPDSTWAWTLTEVDGRTRLATRLRILYQWHASPFGARASLVLNEHGDFAMMRRMLLTLKQRAEAHPQ